MIGIASRKQPEIALVLLGAGVNVFGLQIEDIALETVNFLHKWQTRGFKVVELRRRNGFRQEL